MASRTELLKAEIDKTKTDLARHLAELGTQARAARRSALSRTGIALAIVAGGVVLFKLVRTVRRDQED